MNQINSQNNVNKNSSQSLSLSNLNCVIEDFGDEVLELVKAKSKGPLYTKFVKAFLNYIPVDYRSPDKIFVFDDFTDEAFSFFQERSDGIRKIEITDSSYQNNPAITILIATDNRPFIIDSLNCLFARLNLNTAFTFHPVISCKRDTNGNLQEIYARGEEGTREALVFIKIVGHFSSQDIKSLTKEVNDVIELVDYTYDSWQALLSKVIGMNLDIAGNKDIYEKKGLPADETLDFLNWLQKNNFTFLGMADFDTVSNNLTEEEGVKNIWQNNLSEIRTIIECSKGELYKEKLAILGKINMLSPVHRSSLVDYVLIKRLDENGDYISGTIIFGLYGSSIYYQSIKNIPILRQKMKYVLYESGFPPNGYNAKKIKNIIESLPRETLIQIDERDLYCMCIHMLSSMRSHLLKLFIQKDWSGSFLNIIIFLPRERLTPEAYNDISNYLSEKFQSVIISDGITVVAQNFTHLFATLAIKSPESLDFSPKEIEQDLIKITTTWSDALLHKLNEEYGEYEGSIKHKEIEPLFPSSYRHKFDAETTILDFQALQRATNLGRSVFNLIDSSDGQFVLKIYNPSFMLTLSHILPSIENLGFTAIDEQSFVIPSSENIKQSWIYEFILSSPNVIETPFQELKANIEEALDKMTEGILASDSLSKLLVLSGFKWTQVKLLRALTRYLHQTGFVYGKGYVQLTLLKHYKFTEKLIDLFEAKFDPQSHSIKRVKVLSAEIFNYLDSVSSSSEDKVLRNMHLLIEAIIRTNYYQAKSGDIKEYLSFKFNSSKIPDLPLPVPYAEIFVYSNDFEGVHLRGGKVARGGLRWSDRGEDYRTEALSLMKAQMTKNTVIVPVGSKGSFYVNVHQDHYPSQDDYMKKVISCYKNFLRGMLDVTDNLFEGKVIKPHNTVIYDEDDPYLVVAADKGTATFSDHANEVSKEYKFWLGDAFASGGSAGYDHKKMGITAKGAWISVKSHFQNIGIDVQTTPFTVAGIGDMSGDVFGNGMLLSRQIKLVAAFNHQHIFIDPDPDPEASYLERERLFLLPRSKWSDYNANLISRGGGVFDRFSKAITISLEIQELLDLSESVIAPDDLIKAILKANVDLLWNGGIGTYIKAQTETNFDIGDKTNDNVRCNGNQIRAKVIAEGGNLGVSQLGRIEYALAGGRVNTDFIDNSAGVDCSDHEVNIKVALTSAVESGKISLEERNKILEQMTSQVEELVLIDNYDQNQALAISQFSPAMTLESFGQLITELEKEGLLDPKIEFLPNETELARRAMAREGMTRAELAVILSYSKISVDNDLSLATLTEDKYFEKYLFEYFPSLMRVKFSEEIKNHPLKSVIIRTMITNKMINQLGGPIISSIKSETGGVLCDIARAHSIVCEVFNLDELWDHVEALSNDISTRVKVEMFADISKIMRRGISWFLRNSKHPMAVSETIEKYAAQTRQLNAAIHKSLVGESKTNLQEKIEYYQTHGIDHELATNIATLDTLVSAFDIIQIAAITSAKDDLVAQLYFSSGDILNIDWLRKSCEMQIDESYWNRLSIQSLKDDFYDKQRRLIIAIIKKDGQNINLASWLENNNAISSIFTDFVANIKTQEIINLNMLILANKKFEMFLRKLG